MAPRRGGNAQKPMKRSQMNKNDQKPAYKMVTAEGEGATSMDVELLGRMGGQSASLALHQNPQHGSGSLRILKSMASVAEVKAPHSAKFRVVCCGSPTT
jgi:hypothetical protein